MSESSDDKQIVININLADHFPQPVAPVPQFYPVAQPQMPRSAIAFPNSLKGIADVDIDGYWVAAFLFLTIALYPSADARIFMAWRGDAAGGIVDSAPIPDNPFENEFVDPAPAPKPQSPPSPEPKAPAKLRSGTIFQPNPNKNFNSISQARKKIAELAIADARKGLHYKVGQSARCADYVDNVLSRAGWNAKQTITKQPIDKFRDTGKYMANRWFGPDIGEVITDPSKLEVGDLVAFRNTYGNWRKGAITHVGIYVGRGMIVDRGTAAAPVLYRSIRTFDKGGESKFSVGVRLHEKWFNGNK